MFKNKKFRIIALTLLFVSGFLVRLYKINAPLADWHSWRQADTASVAREFLKTGYNLLKPKYHDLSSIPSGKANPQGYRMVEFPIYNALHALSYQASEQLPFEINFVTAGRLVSIFASLTSAYFLFLIVKNEINLLTAFLSTSFFLLLPFSIFYSRTILPGQLMVAVSLASIYFINFKLHLVNPSNIISLVLGATALLIKPYAVFILAPSFLILCLKNNNRLKFNYQQIFKASLSLFIITVPLLSWRQWIKQFPAGIPANQWLLNQGKMRFRPAWWRWLFAERLGKLILGYWGATLFGLGLIAKTNQKIPWLFYSWAGGILAYFAIFARGNIQHDYYQIIAIPTVSVFLGLGSTFLINLSQSNHIRYFNYLLLIVTAGFSLAFSWFHIREYYKINHPGIVAAGQRADRILPENAKVIAPYGGDTAFLFQTNRRGWPALTGSIDEMVNEGAEYYISANFDDLTNKLREQCPVMEKTDEYIIINLKKCNNESKE